jgi:hypothetical protein
MMSLSGGDPSAGVDAERPAEAPASAAAHTTSRIAAPVPSADAATAGSGGHPERKAKVSLRLQAEAAQRELAMRHRVYPGLVKRGKMTAAEADGEIAAMRAIRDTLRLFAEHEDAVRSTLARAIEARRHADELDELRTHPAVTAVLDEFPGSTIAGLTTPPEAPADTED